MVEGPVLFLDCDGVINNHKPTPSGYNGFQPWCVSSLNMVLDRVPELKIVVSSAWRYMILKGEMTLAGFEMLLMIGGVRCHERVIGHTAADGPIEDEPHHHDEKRRWHEAGLKWRKKQIYDWAFENRCKQFVVLDDLDLGMPELHRTDGAHGMTDEDAIQVLRKLKVLGAQ